MYKVALDDEMLEQMGGDFEEGEDVHENHDHVNEEDFVDLMPSARDLIPTSDDVPLKENSTSAPNVSLPSKSPIKIVPGLAATVDGVY